MNIPIREDFAEHPIKYQTEIDNKKPTVEELSTILKQFSKMLEVANLQKPELSHAFFKLANILSRYKDKSINDVLDGLTIVKRTHSVKPSAKSKISESDITFLTLEKIEELLDSEDLDKYDLIVIATTRFGMSKADLMRMKKTYIVDRIKTAISHLRTIEIIGKQASGNSKA